ncbi:MAG: dephospho-CoA kinase [Bacteroidaceae bacterium]|nr:dephospho-CoA kinase [Bacteroidaceae bacterium]
MHYAITGGIASGKTWFCHKLQQHGNEVYSCDIAAKRIIREDPQVRKALTDLVGESLYDEAHQLQKSVLAAFITQSKEQAAKVNAIVHPRVAADYIRWRDAQKTMHTFMECALLFESGFDQYVERIILIYADESTRLRRLMQRDGISLSQAQQWLDLQMPEDEKRQLAHVIIDNDPKAFLHLGRAKRKVLS